MSRGKTTHDQRYRSEALMAFGVSLCVCVFVCVDVDACAAEKLRSS